MPSSTELTRQFQLSQHCKLASTFKEMERLRMDGTIKEWSLAKTTLDEVFLNVVRAAEKRDKST